MTIIFNRKSIFVVFCLMLLHITPGFAQQARLANVVLTNNRDDLLIFLSVEGAFNEDMKAAILSGVPTTFAFRVTLEKIKNFWINQKIVEKRTTNTINYNPLKKTFTIKRSWENDPIVTDSFTEAVRLMSDVDSLSIVPLNVLEKGAQYQIKAKAELDKLTLPFHLHYVFFFLSMWDFETDWYIVKFYY
ncbi:MAG: DUF4390 domain-containing protein [Desulfobacterales bacterium]